MGGRRVSVLVVFLIATVVVGCAARESASPVQDLGAAPPPPQAGAAALPDPDPWPRTIQGALATLLVYSPQVESWQADLLTFRCAVRVTTSVDAKESFGVIWGTARTRVDRESRMVVLENMALTRSNFPTLDDNGASYLGELRSSMPTASKTIALDRIEASLAASGAAAAKGLAVQNTVPRIFVSYSPAILVPIEGKPILKRVPGTAFDRVLNTHALIVRSGGGPYLVHVYDGWMSAPALEGPWVQNSSPPAGIDAIAADLASKGVVDLLDGGGAQTKPTFIANGPPAIYTSQVAAELVVFRGQPELMPVSGTSLLWCTNTTSDVVVDEGNGRYYLLLSGRWYSGQSLTGPWAYLPSTSLPIDFVQIPPSSPAGVVLSSVAGTPQAREAVISNSVPQTATVPLANPPAFSVAYDGAPSLLPIAGTPLQYVANSPNPVIRVSSSSWYALKSGVWFRATSATGPWTVASSVPAVIYTIPVSSPLHYVTYVQIYDATPEVVYVGYTPGYLGTVVASDGVVVYGTGYEYQPWVGNVYYAAPETWGIEAQPVYNPVVGWGYGYGMGLTTAAMVSSWGSPYYYSSYHGYPCCGTASANVYGQYGNVKYSGTTGWYANSSGYGKAASGTYSNERTGSTGTYYGSRGYDADSNSSYASSGHTTTTQSGATTTTQRGASYDYDTGKYAYSGSKSATTASGNEVTHSTSGETGEGVDRSTTATNTTSGKSYTTGTGDRGNNVYAGADGNAYKSSGDGGWQKSTSSGWQKSGGDNDWANSEQHARSQSQSSFSKFNSGGFGDRSGGFGGGGFGGGGFGGGGFRGGGRR